MQEEAGGSRRKQEEAGGSRRKQEEAVVGVVVEASITTPDY
jgi:hypothetical protein